MATLNLNITVPDEHATEIVTTLSNAYGYSPNDREGNPIPNYPTRANFLKASIREVVRIKYKEAKQGEAFKEAMDETNALLELIPFT